jgi:hypothetical protein
MNDLSKINSKIWNIGKQRAEIIAPLFESSICSREMVQDAANKLKLSPRYVYIINSQLSSIARFTYFCYSSETKWR